MPFLTNAELWNACRNEDESFASKTPEVTDAYFTQQGFEALVNGGGNILGEFYALTMKIHLQKVEMDAVRDVLGEQGFGEAYSGDIGAAITQRIYTKVMDCINPQWMGLKDGDSVDQDVIRKMEAEESFWQQNENIANLVTVPDRFQYKALFTETYGLDAFATAQSKSIVEGFRKQRALDVEEALSNIFDSKDHPLQDTQKYKTPDLTSADNIVKFIELVNDIVDTLVYSKTGAGGKMNAGGRATKVDKNSLCLLADPKLYRKLKTLNKLNAPELAMPEIKEIKLDALSRFGGIKPVITASEKYAKGTVKLVSDDSTPSYAEYADATANAAEATLVADLTGAIATPIYKNKLGERVATAYYLSTGIATTGSGQGAVTYKTIYIPVENARYEDPHADVLAVIADKGVIFYNELNPVNVEPHRNAAGRYTNLWLSSPDNAVLYDHRRTFVVINKAQN